MQKFVNDRHGVSKDSQHRPKPCVSAPEAHKLSLRPGQFSHSKQDATRPDPLHQWPSSSNESASPLAATSLLSISKSDLSDRELDDAAVLHRDEEWKPVPNEWPKHTKTANETARAGPIGEEQPLFGLQREAAPLRGVGGVVEGPSSEHPSNPSKVPYERYPTHATGAQIYDLHSYPSTTNGDTSTAEERIVPVAVTAAADSHAASATTMHRRSSYDTTDGQKEKNLSAQPLSIKEKCLLLHPHSTSRTRQFEAGNANEAVKPDDAVNPNPQKPWPSFMGNGAFVRHDDSLTAQPGNDFNRQTSLRPQADEVYESNRMRHEFSDGAGLHALSRSHDESECDYLPDDLFKRSYGQLKDESFDHDPSSGTGPWPDKVEGDPLESKFKSLVDASVEIQAHAFRSMSKQDWEQAGKWMSTELTAITQQLEDYRTRRREVAQGYESKICERLEAVQREGTSLDETLKDMGAKGRSLLSTSTPQNTPRRRR